MKLETIDSILEAVKEESTCPRAKCAAALVFEGNIISVAANGSATGEVACELVGCTVENNHCVRAQHAEVKVLLQAAKHNIRFTNAAMYTLERPCQGCMSAIAQAGIRYCYFAEDYHSRAHFGEYCSEDLISYIRLLPYERPRKQSQIHTR